MTFDIVITQHDNGEDKVIVDQKGVRNFLLNCNDGARDSNGLLTGGASCHAGNYDDLCRMVVCEVAHIYFQQMEKKAEK